MTSRFAVAAALIGLSVLGACNRYELFRVSGYNQEDFSNDADVLFVIDNSSSMQDEAEALALNFDVFIRRLTDPSQGGHATDGLPDAVRNYIDYVQNRAFVVDYQLAITTTDVEHTYGALYGDMPILDNAFDGDQATAFDRNLLCNATCFVDANAIPSDPTYTCDDPPAPPGDAVSAEYLDCLCGGRSWVGHCGSGTEEPLESVYMAMCRSVDNPPQACFDEIDQFREPDINSDAPLLRDNSTLIPIIVTDEGDTSRRLSQGVGDPSDYQALYAQFGHRMTFAVIGPNPDECNSGGATTWGVERFKTLVDDTNGRYFQISESNGGSCGVADFEAAMEQLGELLNGLRVTFVLQGVPDVDTIRAFVGGKPVDQATVSEGSVGETVYGDGWTYDAIDNAVTFHGAAVPDYGVGVKIYYLPVEGMPRELPF